ncbi:RNA polymerase-binding protein RbpA [Rarobacter incanus]|uniref:RNA polymerase-binding protein RbpA n=1 Tax=Rarobacter incanus TaxID=153494 RepID=A0A542SM22_9MICO|nr:RNA polymerase-binding protein RbpA [Rarobacter incanus]TQK75673.1 RNA polymerase binding protein RbpA [Rarobacter incanus]
MADRSLRGMSIGSKSMESDEGVDFAPRQEAIYDCPNGHTIVLPFAREAEIPAAWECRCGAEAGLRDPSLASAESDEKPQRPVRTHWDMLLERRSEDELKVLLDERLDLLRAGKLRRG